jgi:hypothetical protein
MQAETKDAIARTIATHIISTRIKEMTRLEINEVTYDEIGGLDDGLAEEIVGRVETYVDVADVHVSFPAHRINRQTGELKTQEEIEAEFSAFSAPLF